MKTRKDGLGMNRILVTALALGCLCQLLTAQEAPKTRVEHPREPTEWIVSYAYNANDTKLPRVLLVGDSICNGYNKEVCNELAGTAYVTFFATSKCVCDKSYLRAQSAGRRREGHRGRSGGGAQDRFHRHRPRRQARRG